MSLIKASVRKERQILLMKMKKVIVNKMCITKLLDRCVHSLYSLSRYVHI